MKKNIDIVLQLEKKYKLKSLTEYKGVDYHMDWEDNQGYKYSYTPYNLSQRKNLNLSTGRFNNKNTYRQYNMLLYVKQSKSDTQILDIPTNIDNEVCTFKCGCCGNIYKQLWKIYVCSELKCCNNCVAKNKRTKQKDNSYIENLFKTNGYELLENGDKGMHYAYYVEDDNGFKGRMLPYSALKKDSKIELFHVKNKYSIYNINLYCNMNSIDVRCMSDVFGTHKRLSFVCKCGNVFNSTWDVVKRGKHRCNKCSCNISNNEVVIEDFLIKNGFKYTTQYNIKKYGDFNNLYFDFYLLEYNLFIEVDGEQHFRPVKFGGVSMEKAKENFEKQQLRDKAKNEYCKKNNKQLLRISYLDIKDNQYESIISSKIDELRK